MALKQASCRQCRREGEKLFLKGERCHSQKCALVKKSYPPGLHGNRRTKLSNYAIQLREKQKTKRIYGMRESQFFKYYTIAAKKKGVTGIVLLQLLETRLDNVVYRLGWAASRKLARQIVSHGHITVNGKKVDIPSYQCEIGEIIAVKENAKEKTYFKEILSLHDYKTPVWLKSNASAMSGEVVAMPTKDDLDLDINEQLIIEFYSR